MKSILTHKSLNGQQKQPPSSIGKLQEEGHIAYLAGGCKGYAWENSKDYDIATSAISEQIYDFQ